MTESSRPPNPEHPDFVDGSTAPHGGNADGQIVMPEDAAARWRERATRSLFHRSLPGEYVALALLLHATFATVGWAIRSIYAPAGFLFVAAGVWVVIRVTGAFAQRTFTVLVTGVLIILLLTIQQQRFQLPTPSLVIFSWQVFIAMLGIVLLIDVVELATSPRIVATYHRMGRGNWGRVAAGLVLIAFLIYMVVIPTANLIIERMYTSDFSRVQEEMSFSEHVRLRSMEAMTAFWFLALGATIGSFLNVVVYRMPRGESIVFRRSRCPQCGTQIKGRDNVPILGWLLLNGRCRVCQMDISIRYPLVESLTAAIFLLLYFVELISGGANIPVRSPNLYHGVVWIIFYTKWDLVSLYLFHCFSISVLLTWALVDFDRQRIPLWGRWCVGLLLCALPSVLLYAFGSLRPGLQPDLLPVTWLQGMTFEPDWPKWLLALSTSIVGGLAGALLGWIISQATRLPFRHVEIDAEELGEVPPYYVGHLTSAGMIVGLTVGWQATVGVLLLAFAFRPVSYLAARRWSVTEPPMTVILLAAFLLHLVGWRWLTTGWWPSAETTPIAWGAASVGFAMLWLVNRSISAIPRPKHESSVAVQQLPTFTATDTSD